MSLLSLFISLLIYLSLELFLYSCSCSMASPEAPQLAELAVPHGIEIKQFQFQKFQNGYKVVPHR